jgi:hypothetical protein
MNPTASLVDLRKACSDAGLPTYGNKDQLLERLNAAAASDLANSDESPVEVTTLEADTDAQATTAVMQQSASFSTAAAAPEPMPSHAVPSQPLILQAPANAPARTSFAGQAADLLAHIRNKFPGLIVKLDAHNEVFTFEGGRQGKVTTTIHQPMAAIVGQRTSVADKYVQDAQAAVMAGRTVEGALGELGNKSMVYQ